MKTNNSVLQPNYPGLRAFQRKAHVICQTLVCCLTTSCGILNFGGTDGESSFLDGKTRTIGASPHDLPDAAPVETTSVVGQTTASNEGSLDAQAPVDPIYVGAWTTTIAPSTCVSHLNNPIAGCDPELNPTWDLDCDEDGVADHVAYECDPANTELAAPFYGRYDCAPDDPSRAIWVATDFDADGYKAHGDFNCSGPVLAPGYVPDLDGEVYDCDDQNPNTHPNATETWGDSLDSDCNGADEPSCTSVGISASWRLAPVETSDCSFGADLHFLAPAFCGERCRTEGTFYLVITNSGNVASPADVRVSHTDDTNAAGETRLPAISPGAATLVTVPFTHATEIHVRLEVDDCSVDDNTLLLPAGGDKQCLY